MTILATNYGVIANGAVDEHVEALGYRRPDRRLLWRVAAMRAAGLAERISMLRAGGVTQRLVVRALGFNIEGQPQISVGLGKATFDGSGARVTEKASVLLEGGDDFVVAMAIIDMVADAANYERIAACDRDLLKAAVSTIAGRELNAGGRPLLERLASANIWAAPPLGPMQGVGHA